MAARSLARRASPSGAAQLPVTCRACTLRRKQAFRPLSGSELSFVATMRKGQIALKAGEQLAASGNSSFYTLYDGWAARTRTLADGSRQILDILLPGNMVGLSAAALRTRTFEILALTDVTLCELEASQLATLFRRHPALAFSILDGRFQDQERADARLTALGRMGAGERIAHLLLDLREQLERRGMCEGKSVPFPLQRMQLADAVGLSKVHLMRALRELKLLGLVSLAGRRLTIPDVRRLGRYCGYRNALPRRACAIL